MAVLDSSSQDTVDDLSCSLVDFGYHTQRSYFETSHAKGEQDAAGSHVKQIVSQAILERKARITNAESMYKYLCQKFFVSCYWPLLRS